MWNKTTTINRNGVNINVRIYATPKLIEVKYGNDIIVEHKYQSLPIDKDTFDSVIRFAFDKINKLEQSVKILRQI